VGSASHLLQDRRAIGMPLHGSFLGLRRPRETKAHVGGAARLAIAPEEPPSGLGRTLRIAEVIADLQPPPRRWGRERAGPCASVSPLTMAADGLRARIKSARSGDQLGTTRCARYRTDHGRANGNRTCIACVTCGNAYRYVLGVKAASSVGHRTATRNALTPDEDADERR
jgi:hypothetical protein